MRPGPDGAECLGWREDARIGPQAASERLRNDGFVAIGGDDEGATSGGDSIDLVLAQNGTRSNPCLALP